MKTTHYDVRPRYTGGSPARVPESIALGIIAQERRGCEIALRGAHGPEEQAEAQRYGVNPRRAPDGRVRGIVEAIEQHTAAGHFAVHDLMTGQRYRRSFVERTKPRRCNACDTVGAVSEADMILEEGTVLAISPCALDVDLIMRATDEGGFTPAVDAVFDYFDGLFLAGKFAAANRDLAMLNLADMCPTLVVSVLTITSAARHRLLSRHDAVKRAERRLLQVKGNSADVDLIMCGLR